MRNAKNIWSSPGRGDYFSLLTWVRDYNCSGLANPTLVSEVDESYGGHAQTVTSDKRDIVSSKQALSITSHRGQTDCMQVFGESLTKEGISAEAAKIILKS